MKKFLIISVLALALLFGAYCYRDTILDALPIDQSGWEIRDGVSYYLGEKGDPITGWLELKHNVYYFDAPTGAMHTGWLELDAQRYYFDISGKLLREQWFPDGDHSCYLGADGAVQTGWLTLDGKRYYLDTKGHPLTGWQALEDARYYFNEDGTAATGWLETAEGRFYLNADGSSCTGWVELEGTRHYLNEQGVALSGWADTPQGRFFLDDWGIPHTGTLVTDQGLYYFREDGTPYTGWVEEEGMRRCFDETGKLRTGWYEEAGSRYYLREDGTPAVGKLVIDGETCFFSSAGVQFILVNPWNSLPESFQLELVEVPGAWLDPVCQDALEQMLADCREAGFYPRIISSYRSIADQRVNLNNMITARQEEGYSYAQAYAYATKIVAVPGTSEHHLGLAFDIVDSGYTKLDYQQANMPTQQWLMENSWKYGFIIRYPEGTTQITGIIYEPWHYRYVGIDMAREIHELGITLEEYVDMLTADGTTCGGQTG